MMGNRKFRVCETAHQRTGKLLSFMVTDVLNDEELQHNVRPSVVTFPISQLYDSKEQRLRADQYADFLNKINEATLKAYQNTQLLDIMRT